MSPPSMTSPLLSFRSCTSEGMYIACRGPITSDMTYDGVFAIEAAAPVHGPTPAASWAGAGAAVSAASASVAGRTTERAFMGYLPVRGTVDDVWAGATSV